MQPNHYFYTVCAATVGVLLGGACGSGPTEAPEATLGDTGGNPSSPPPSGGGGGTGGVELAGLGGQSDPGGAVCGDSVISPGEGCDDGNPVAGDGCDVACLLEPGFVCLEPGVACIAVICGDGSRTAGEACDDRNTTDGDGCSASCLVEPGWVCPSEGTRCLPKCGDAILIGAERCDDSNTTNGDGCSASCLVEPGWFDCPPVTAACQRAICGNGVVEANEGCDDANDISGDGCNATCLREPVFIGGQATAVCGDGARTLGEACDDGNLQGGDGCDAACAVELGFTCTEERVEPETVRLPVVYRDFTDEHADFELGPGPVVLGIPGEACTLANAATCGLLDAEGKPVMAPGTHDTMSDAANYAQWYRDVAGVNLAIPGVLELTRLVEGGQTVYRFESDEFFPLDGLGFGNYLETGHNFHFTTELQYFIQYAGGEFLDFAGDDDVWIYVNGHLAVDIGGIHGVEEGSVLLGDEDGDGVLSATEAADPTDDRFGITKGQLYTIHLFHAERHVVYSNFRLTLSNFILSWSICTPICGNGTIEPGELCDDGEALNTGEYGACAPDCSGREYCGDGVVQAAEECDNGVNQSPYNSTEGCGPGCEIPARCGDESLDAEYAETCDLGAANGVRRSGCDAACHVAEIVE